MPSKLCHTCLVISGVKNGKLGETWLHFREMWLLLCIGILQVREVFDGELIGPECRSKGALPGKDWGVRFPGQVGTTAKGVDGSFPGLGWTL